MAVLIIFPVILQTDTDMIMLSTGGEGTGPPGQLRTSSYLLDCKLQHHYT